MPHTIVMVATSYPRFPGDTVGTFMEPIAHGIAARGHTVHIVAPWHPRVDRPSAEGDVRFHFFRYAPTAALNTFGYAQSLRPDVALRRSALAVAPFALVAGWRAARRVARRTRATVMHGHWVIPGGAIADAAAGGLPVVVSLHGSGLFVAERYAVIARVARSVLRRATWVTACSRDLERRAVAMGAHAQRIEVLPYGVDAARFKPDSAVRSEVRHRLGLSLDDPVVFSAGRLVRKKGFEYLIDSVAKLRLAWPHLQVVLAGGGDLEPELRDRAARLGVADHMRFLGAVPHGDMPDLLAAADIAVAPSVRDEAGNVDGLPNVVLEALASGTPLVTTAVGGIGAVAVDGETALVVPPAVTEALAAALDVLLRQPEQRRALDDAARDEVVRERSWSRVSQRFEEIYDRVVDGSAS